MYIHYVLFSHILLEVVWKVCFNSSVQVICTVCHTEATQTVNGIKNNTIIFNEYMYYVERRTFVDCLFNIT